MEVLCINDANLPPGAEIAEGKTYKVTDVFTNNLDQKVYYLSGINNKGRTKFGLPWNGYRADRFMTIGSESAKNVEKKESHLILN